MRMWIKNIKLKEVHLRWAGILLVSFIMTFIYSGLHAEKEFWQRYLISLAFTTFYWNIAFYLFIFFRKKYPQIRQTPKRLLATFASITILFATIGPIICVIFNLHPPEDIFNATYFNRLVVDLFATAIIGSVYENVYYFENWKETIQMNESLKNQQVRMQFEVLQNQMSPHFLFNSLNTLAALIAEDSKIAINFTERLSEVYRYILQNKEKDVVTLADELEFVRNYVYLLKIRYSENLEAYFNIDKSHLSKNIAPLTIQILVENAIKHNTVSKAKPLYINIYVENGNSIVVKNNLQIKNVIEKSTKTGLANIRQRYAYFKKEIDVSVLENDYLVAVPLLEIIPEREPAPKPHKTGNEPSFKCRNKFNLEKRFSTNP